MTFASAADENVAVAAQVNENGYTSEIIGRVRVQVLSPTVVRLEEQGPKGFEDRETFHIANRDNWEGTGVTREDADGSVILRLSLIHISCAPRKNGSWRCWNNLVPWRILCSWNKRFPM